MSIIYIVLPLALLIVLSAVVAFVWATRHGQFDDLDTPALRMLHDDDGATVRRRPPSAEEPKDDRTPEGHNTTNHNL